VVKKNSLESPVIQNRRPKPCM